MAELPDSWATGQLTELLAAVSGHADSAAAVRDAVERVGTAVEAEVVAVLGADRVEASIGFPAADVPERELLDAAEQGARESTLPGLGRCQLAVVPLEGGTPGLLLVARVGEEIFSSAERNLLRAMGRVISLALRNVVLLETLRLRETLLERLSRVQRSIAARRDLDEVLEAIVAGASELVGDPVAGVRLIDPEDPTSAEMVATTGVPPELRAKNRRTPVGAGAGGLAIELGEVVVVEGYERSNQALDSFAADGLQAAMAAPIYERGEIAGSIVVASYDAARTYDSSEREVLSSFAEHAGLALNEARATAEAVHLAFHDPLTGLPNRAQFLADLEGSLDRRRGVAVLFADLDGFKTVNDSLGHDAGDELLVLVSRRLAGAVRPSDSLARFGGDEFALLIDGIRSEKGAAVAAQRVLEVLKQPFAVAGREVFISASVGMALGRGGAEDLLRDVDLAMYQAKGRGRGQHEMFKPEMHGAALQRLELEADLKRAIERGEFILHYQPICNLETGAILAVEALVRWQHPQRGLVSPLEFIPLAEESGQIVSLGRWVLREACQKAALWRARYPEMPNFQVSVNISGVQLEHTDLVAEVRSVLESSDLPPESLVLEITESALMADQQDTVHKLSGLRELGARIAVDDFGTGYSSLEYLRRFPLDILKIAKPFIDDLCGPRASSAIAHSIADLGKNLGLSVVAEGIEEIGQRSRLIELGCAIGQGFHFSTPVPAWEMDSLLLQAGVLGERWTSVAHPRPAGLTTGEMPD